MFFIIYNKWNIFSYSNFKKTYGKNNLKNLAFKYFLNSFYIKFLKWFYLKMPASLLIYLISNCYELENIPFYKKLLINKFGFVNKKKLLFSRLLNCFFMLFFLFFLNDEYYLTFIGKIVFVPFVGFIFPVF